MKRNVCIVCYIILILVLSSSCTKRNDEPEEGSNWITLPQYDFPIFIGKRGGVVVSSAETFGDIGFMEVGDSLAFDDSLEWKVIPYTEGSRELKSIKHVFQTKM